LNFLLQLVPEYRDYVWGGGRLKPGTSPIAEAWVVYEQDRIAAGPYAGQSLAEVAAKLGADLLGEPVMSRTGAQFPLLIKLLDCAQWLSLQVHPDDEQARRLEGPGFFGKTEAWHVLEAEAGAKLVAGLKPGTSADTLAQAIRNGTIIDWAQYLPVQAGDSIFMRPGTIHALGPGLLIYEVQQTSDLTYRVWDWNRPQTGRRVLHIEKSLAVANATATGNALPLPPIASDGGQTLIACPYFTLALFAARSGPLELDTRGATFHALTVIEGQAEVRSGDARVTLGRFETVVVPAAAGVYHLQPLGSCRVLRASVEGVPGTSSSR
jgi:mannose-6-phosphate isomerase